MRKPKRKFDAVLKSVKKFDKKYLLNLDDQKQVHLKFDDRKCAYQKLQYLNLMNLMLAANKKKQALVQRIARSMKEGVEEHLCD